MKKFNLPDRKVIRSSACELHKPSTSCGKSWSNSGLKSTNCTDSTSNSLSPFPYSSTCLLLMLLFSAPKMTTTAPHHPPLSRFRGFLWVAVRGLIWGVFEVR